MVEGPDTTMPYTVDANINGFKNQQVLAKPFAGSSPSQQITWMLTVKPGGYFHVKDSFGNILKPNSLILPGYTLTVCDQDSLPFGADVFYPTEGPWTVVERVLNTDSLQFWYQNKKAEQKRIADSLAQEAKLDRNIAEQDAEIAVKQKLEHEAFLRLLRNVGIPIGLLFFSLILLLLYQMKNSPAAKRRREETMSQILAARQKEIQLNLENDVPVYLAGEPQVPGGLDPISAKHRLEHLSGATIVKFAPVRVEFLKPVNIGYAHAYAMFQPKATDTTIYYLGETQWGVIVLCAMRCGNSIIGAEGQNLQLGIDFIVVEAVQNEEIKNYLWAADFVTEKNTAE